MARNKSEKLPSCPAAIAYADAVDARRLTGRQLSNLWDKISGRFKESISHERRFRKTERGSKYLSEIEDPSRRDYVINAQIIREWYGP